MSLLNNLQKMLGDKNLGDILSGLSGGGVKDGLTGKSSNVPNALGPAALGGLIGALLTSKGARGTVGGALLAGGGSILWNKYKEMIANQNKDNPQYSETPSDVGVRAERLIRAMVFAAKSDGNVNDAERAAMVRELEKLNLGKEAEALVQKALEEPLNPSALAKDVKSADEALEVYAVSCAVVTGEHFMERSYLDALAGALNIPKDVQKELENGLRQASA